MARRVQSESASEDDQQPQQGQNGQNVERPAPQKTVQHMFLQTLIARRMLTIEMADAVYNKCAELCGREYSIELVVDALRRVERRDES